MARDELGDDVPVTHETLTLTLATPRASVTEGLQALAGRGFLETGRRRVTIHDRAGLIRFAGPLYEQPEAEYVALGTTLTGEHSSPAFSESRGAKHDTAGDEMH